MQKNDKKYSISEVSKIDREIRNLSSIYSATRIKVGMTLAQRIKEIEENKLYLKLDEKAYPNFSRYIESIGMNYKSVMQLLGLYNTFVLVAGFSVDELSKISYPKLSVLKPYLFSKKEGKYILLKPLSEVKKWVKDAASDLSIEDLKQLRREKEIGPHEHDFKIVKYKVCRVCGLREGDY